MKIRQGAFYTFIGDFYCDFSPLFGFVLLFIISFIFYANIIQSDGIYVASSKLFVVFFYACICYNGLFYFSYKDIGGNLRLIVNILFVLLLKITPVNIKENA